MYAYLDMLEDIRDNGYDHEDRTGVGRRSVVSRELRFDLSENKLPVVTTRQIFLDAITNELVWFIRGSDSVKDLQELGVKFWNQWAVKESDINAFVDKYLKEDPDEDNPAFSMREQLKQNLKDRFLHSIGPIYGPVWRNISYHQTNILWPSSNIDYQDIPSDKKVLFEKMYEETKFMMGGKMPNDQEFPTLEQFSVGMYAENVDQLNQLIIGLRDRPYSSRHVVVSWVPTLVPFEGLSPEENVLMERGALAPCHAFFQCFVKPPATEGGKLRLSLKLTQRSADVPVGVPFNIAQYSLLTHLLAHTLGYEADEFIWSGGDVHIYHNQLGEDKVDLQLSRQPYASPTVRINPELNSIFDLKPSDVEILNYKHHPEIKYEVAK